MLNPSARALLFEKRNSDVRRIADVRPNIRQLLDPKPIGNSPLKCYLEGWAEVNLSKILAGTAHNYRFDDPLVGLFTRWSFPAYFEHLQARFAGAGAIAAKDLAFFIRGPMDGPLSRGGLKFFREAPRLGLTGITFITIGEHGVIAESVAYDLNLALAVHQRTAPTEQL
jgi:hypothetical protein